MTLKSPTTSFGFAVACACAAAWGALSQSDGPVLVPNDFATIQQAIDAAEDGSEILVAPGTYTENILIEFKTITLRSESGPEHTVIQADDDRLPVARVFLTDTAGDVIIDGFTLTGGRGGLSLAFAEVDIIDCIIQDNTGGSGIDMFWSNLNIVDSQFIENGDSNITGGGIRCDFSFITLQHVTMARNRASLGGAIHLIETNAHLHACTFDKNEADDGGALAIALATVSVFDTNWSGNTALNAGGAIFVEDTIGTTLSIDNCSLSSNTATQGGGIWIGTAAIVDVAASSFCGNSVDHIDGRWNDLQGNTFQDHCHATGDLNGDGVVDISDLLILLSAWGQCPNDEPCYSDLNGDGVVDTADLMILLANWS